MIEFSLLEMVLVIFGALVSMALLCCLCCLCMKLSDMKLRSYIIKTATRKGIQVDLDKLEARNAQTMQSNENCTIIVPEVGIIL